MRCVSQTLSFINYKYDKHKCNLSCSTGRQIRNFKNIVLLFQFTSFLILCNKGPLQKFSWKKSKILRNNYIIRTFKIDPLFLINLSLSHFIPVPIFVPDQRNISKVRSMPTKQPFHSGTFYLFKAAVFSRTSPLTYTT